MKVYKIKLEDKAALINSLKKIGIGVGSYDVVDNKLKDYFEITFKNPQEEDDAKSILRSHTGIDQLKEVLRRMIREELSK